MVVRRHPVAPTSTSLFANYAFSLLLTHFIDTSYVLLFGGLPFNPNMGLKQRPFPLSSCWMLFVWCYVALRYLLFLLNECLLRCASFVLFASNGQTSATHTHSFEFYRPLRTKASIATASTCSTETALKDMYKLLPALSSSNWEAFFNFKLWTGTKFSFHRIMIINRR